MSIEWSAKNLSKMSGLSPVSILWSSNASIFSRSLLLDLAIFMRLARPGSSFTRSS